MYIHECTCLCSTSTVLLKDSFDSFDITCHCT